MQLCARSVCQECGESLRKKPQTLWTFLKDTGLVREKYLTYNPEDIEEIEDLNVLEWLYAKYHLPPGQPQTIEEYTYLALMSSCIGARLHNLRKQNKCFFLVYVFLFHAFPLHLILYVFSLTLCSILCNKLLLPAISLYLIELNIL